MKDRVYILNSPVDNLTMEETLNIIDDSIQKKNQIHHVVVNAAKLVSMQEDKELFDAVVSCDIINADGQSVVWASKFLGKPLPERVTGIDLMVNLVKMSHEKKYKIFFFGAEEEIVRKVVNTYVNQYSEDIIAGYRNGYYKQEDEESIARQIADSGANILFVAITSPKKEKFLYKYANILKNVNFIMGVGGSFDVIADKVKRAPVFFQKTGLEWFYRMMQEPGRLWKRYLVGNSKFISLVVKQKFSSKK